LLGSLIDFFSDIHQGQLCIGLSWGNRRGGSVKKSTAGSRK